MLGRPKCVQLEAWATECIGALKIQESSDWAYEGAMEGLKIMKNSPITGERAKRNGYRQLHPLLN